MIKILRWSFLILTHLLVISVLPGMLIVNHPLHPPLSPTSSYIVIVNILIQSNGFSSPDYCCAGCCPPPGHSSPSSFSLRGSTVSRKLHRTQGKEKLLFLWVSILVLSAAKWVWKKKQKFCCLPNIFFGCLSNIFKLGGKSWEKGNWSSSWWEHLTHNIKCSPTPGGLYAATFM